MLFGSYVHCSSICKAGRQSQWAAGGERAVLLGLGIYGWRTPSAGRLGYHFSSRSIISKSDRVDAGSLGANTLS